MIGTITRTLFTVNMMSNDTTTIEIAQWQRKELEGRKNYDGEAVKKVIGRLLNNSDPADAKKVDAAAVAAQIVEQIGREKLTNDDMRDQLDRIEAAAKEATQTAQATHSELEGLQ